MGSQSPRFRVSDAEETHLTGSAGHGEELQDLNFHFVVKILMSRPEVPQVKPLMRIPPNISGCQPKTAMAANPSPNTTPAPAATTPIIISVFSASDDTPANIWLAVAVAWWLLTAVDMTLVDVPEVCIVGIAGLLLVLVVQRPSPAVVWREVRGVCITEGDDVRGSSSPLVRELNDAITHKSARLGIFGGGSVGPKASIAVKPNAVPVGPCVVAIERFDPLSPLR